MVLKINESYNGFKILNKEYIKENHSTAYLMEHIKSGAKLLYLGNEDNNKVFSISFRTPPFDDSGVAHILEHSTLCGSRKYNLKEPFVELVKGSMNTFLNAMTFPDKTMYPVASTNEKDFCNLMDVYLDAVFYPNIYDNKYTFLQEGWHYDLTKIDDELTYNGVVYNEMKGVFSSPDSLLEYESMKKLFPDTPYKFESGGHPDAIPSLTQAKFEKFHKTYYSPQNSYIYLYGDLDIIKTLDYLNKEYLSNFDKDDIKVNSKIDIQKVPNDLTDICATYPVNLGSPVKNKTYFDWSFVIGEKKDILTSVAMKLLESILLEINAAPLRLAIIKEGIATDVSGSYTSGILQPVFSIKASGTDKKNIEKFKEIITNELKNIVEKGLDKSLIESTLNLFEFQLREADFGTYPKGLIYAIDCMEEWLYEENPLESFKYEEVLIKLRKGINTNFYENLIEKYLLNNKHNIFVTLEPEEGKEEKDLSVFSKKMKKTKEQFSEKELSDFIKDRKVLKEKQASPDSEKDLNSIPILDIKDIKKTVEPIEYDVKEEATKTFLSYPQFTNNITYINCQFDMTGINPEILPYAYFLSDIIGKVNTSDYSYQELSTLIAKNTGGINIAISISSDYKSTQNYTIKSRVTGKVLTKNIKDFFEILESITLRTSFDNKTRIKELVNEINTDLESQLFNHGLALAKIRLESYYSNASRALEKGGLSYYSFIKNLVNNFDEEYDKLIKNLEALKRICFHSNNVLFAYSCDEKDLEKIYTVGEKYLNLLPETEINSNKPIIIKSNLTNEAFATTGKVQYVIAGGDFRSLGFEYTGALKVLQTILGYEYLWTKIRVQGGAYGAGVNFNVNGSCLFNTYRDPKLAESLEVFKGIPNYLKTLNLSERELAKYVIGTISSMDKPLTASLKFERAVISYKKGISTEDRQKTRDEILNVSLIALRKLADLVEGVLNTNLHCVFGGKTIIEKNKTIFNEIIDL